MTADESLRRHVAALLDWPSAHVSYERAVADWPRELRGVRPEGYPHSGWELLEHLRIAQWDIIEFSRNASHRSPTWPDGYWPSAAEPPGDEAWNASIAAFERDLRAMKELVLDPAVDLLARIPHGDGQTVLREALLLADHNSYHTGQLVDLRRLLGIWKE